MTPAQRTRTIAAARSEVGLWRIYACTLTCRVCRLAACAGRTTRFRYRCRANCSRMSCRMGALTGSERSLCGGASHAITVSSGTSSICASSNCVSACVVRNLFSSFPSIAASGESFPMITLIAVYPSCISVGDDKNRRLRGSALVKGPGLATAVDTRPGQAHNRGATGARASVPCQPVPR